MKKALLAFSVAAVAGSAVAQPGYVTQPGGGHVMNPFGLCWHSGFWSQDMARPPCDARAESPIPASPPHAAAPVQPTIVEIRAEPAPAPAPVARPEPAPAPAPAAVAPQPVYEKVTFSADVLFDFNKATLKETGKKQLDELADRLRGASLEEIKIVGHADRIGSAKYNQRLSEERAATVKAYLEARSNTRNIQTTGVGSSQPVTGGRCSAMGREHGSNLRLVQCLQADRRVDIELFGMRTAGTAPRGTDAAAGGTQPASFKPQQ